MKDQKKIIKKHYSQLAATGKSCCGNDAEKISKSIGYSDGDLTFTDANMGLGCGNPVAIGDIKEGDTVLDLGSGAGLDCFLAAKKTGESGKVYGLDFSPEMIEKASNNSKLYGFSNIEFILGEIEKIPLPDSSVDVVISNCVINLSPDKAAVFAEIFRVLKQNGRAFLSDIVLLDELSQEAKNDQKLLCGCVSGALPKDQYLKVAASAGLKPEILSEDPEISKKQYDNFPVESLKVKLIK